MGKDDVSLVVPQLKISQWWAQRRKNYNIGLVISGVSAFFYYLIALTIKSHADIHNADPERFEFTLFTILFQGIGYLIMMGVANLFYFLGPFVDRMVNTNGSEKFRITLYNIGFWFSCLLPFTIPFLVLTLDSV